MHRKGMAKRIASIALAAVLLTATLFEGKVNVVAAESREQVSSTTGEAIVMTETKSISAGDVSGGDISDGDTEKEDEKIFLEKVLPVVFPEAAHGPLMRRENL